MESANDKRLFWACFIALVATAFGFIIRGALIDTWAEEFGLSATEKGQISGAGLWPFAVSIILFSLVIDKIGYGRAMIFAFLAHITYAIVVISAGSIMPGDGATDTEVADARRLGFWMLYLGNFIFALGNGTVEAVINPVVATMFSKQKTKWLNILHAGWPGGLVLAGLIMIFLGEIDWRYKVALIFIPVGVYGLMMIGCKFPVQERVAAGTSYRDMLKEFGFLGAVIVTALIVWEVTTTFEKAGLIFTDLSANAKLYWRIGITAALAGTFGAFARSLGRPMFIFLLLIMIPLATTELGTDNWISSLMEPAMEKLGADGLWVLVYTSFIMMVLRFFAGPIVHKLSPLGLLAASSVIAAGGLLALSTSAGIWILAAATLYGFGKTFFWPTMLGVVSEQFPKGGALTLNATGGVGMLGVGVIGAVFIGYIQDRAVTTELREQNPALYEQVVTTKTSVFGEAEAVSDTEMNALPQAQQETITEIEENAKQGALAVMAIFPCIMFVCYLALLFYFKAKGGYEAQELTGHAAKDDEYTGGVEGPVEA